MNHSFHSFPTKNTAINQTNFICCIPLFIIHVPFYLRNAISSCLIDICSLNPRSSQTQLWRQVKAVANHEWNPQAFTSLKLNHQDTHIDWDFRIKFRISPFLRSSSKTRDKQRTIISRNCSEMLPNFRGMRNPLLKLTF